MFDTLRTSQVLEEMWRYKLHILGVSECRWTGFGQYTTSTGEAIIYSGRDDNHHTAGIALMLKKGIKRTLIEWHPVNERKIRARFNGKRANLSIIQCYAPINEANEEEKDAFYGRLQEEVEKVPTHDVLCVISDLNAKVGSDNTNRESAMGKEGCGSMNDNGE